MERRINSRRTHTNGKRVHHCSDEGLKNSPSCPLKESSASAWNPYFFRSRTQRGAWKGAATTSTFFQPLFRAVAANISTNFKVDRYLPSRRAIFDSSAWWTTGFPCREPIAVALLINATFPIRVSGSPHRNTMTASYFFKDHLHFHFLFPKV